LPALVALSFSCSALDRYDEALGYADNSIALAPDTANPYVAKANVLLAMERDLDALQALQSALRCDPRNAEIQLEIGDVCWRNLQRPAQAMENYQAARRSNPALMPVYVRLADLHLQLNQPGEARAALETLRKLPHDARELAALENRLRERTTQ
jgi:tetratricopeptide (TPR) repeat protein